MNVIIFYFKKIIEKLTQLLSFPVNNTPPQFFLNLKHQSDFYKLLNEIPSEASYNERLFLYWLCRMNSLKGNVLEIGPFIGGTTRAIGMGINDNSFSEDYKLLTIDKFDDYYPSSIFKKMGVVSVQDYKDTEIIPFYNIFLDYHSGTSYEKHIIAKKFSLPDKKGDKWNPEILVDFAPYSIVFVDGCKSWYSLKSLFSELAEKMVVGSYVIFQDYGRFTCFWIPVFCYIFKEYFLFEGEVSSTHVFRYKGGLNRETIDQLYTDSPYEWDEIKINKFYDIMDENAHRSFYRTIFKIQRAGFLAYIGQKNQARDLLIQYKKTLKSRTSEYKIISRALISPTYTPEHDILL